MHIFGQGDSFEGNWCTLLYYLCSILVFLVVVLLQYTYILMIQPEFASMSNVSVKLGIDWIGSRRGQKLLFRL